MGSEFIEKAAPTFKKSWDRARVELATATLFTKTPVSLTIDPMVSDPSEKRTHPARPWGQAPVPTHSCSAVASSVLAAKSGSLATGIMP